MSYCWNQSTIRARISSPVSTCRFTGHIGISFTSVNDIPTSISTLSFSMTSPSKWNCHHGWIVNAFNQELWWEDMRRLHGEHDDVYFKMWTVDIQIILTVAHAYVMVTINVSKVTIRQTGFDTTLSMLCGGWDWSSSDEAISSSSSFIIPTICHA